MNTMYRSAVAYLISAIIAAIIAGWVWTYRAPDLVFETAVCSIVLMVALALEIILRKAPRIEVISSFVFFATTVTMAVFICLNHESYVRNRWPFEPFVGFKMIAVLLPVLCPPNRWSSWSSFAVLAILPLQRYYSWEPVFQTAVGIQEPWVTVVFVIAAAVIYEFRLKLAVVQRMEMELSVRSKTLRRFAHLLLGAQHLMNTPLQRMEILVHLMGTKFPDATPLVQKFQACFSSVRQISKILTFADANVHWDAVQLPQNAEHLEAEVKKLISDFK